MNVTVIVPAYNAADTLGDTLRSLCEQTSPSWEAVVVNDGSVDSTSSIARAFANRDARIRVIDQVNVGEATARNAGIREAHHDWLLFLDADDWIAPNHLQVMTGRLSEDASLDAVHCGYARVAADGSTTVDSYRPPTGDLFPTLAHRAAFPVHACIVRRALVDEVGMFDPSLKTSPDWDLWQRVARTGANFGAVPDVLAFYRMSPRGASLDAAQLLGDGLRVLRQGRAADPRVPRPHASHAHGVSEPIHTQTFYLLSWCAGLMLGSGADPRPLFDLVEQDQFRELYPPAVAQCIYEAVPLPSCQPPRMWEALWPTLQPALAGFFSALEVRSAAHGLAAAAMESLKRRILTSSPLWELIREGLDGLQARVDQEAATRQELQARVDQEAATRQARVEQQAATRQELEIRLAEAQARVDQEAAARQALNAQLVSRTAERDALQGSYEQRLGHLLLNRSRLKGLALRAASAQSSIGQRLSVARLAVEGRRSSRGRLKVLATACDVFPIYSQTFVYQELSQLAKHGFDIRFVYSKLDSRDRLATPFAHLWQVKRRLHLNDRMHERDYAHYRRRFPAKVDALLGRLSDASGMSRADVEHHGNVLQAFSFARMVEAYRPDYLHSYFFYDRSLMALVAGYLLEIPRGISCYADHVLKDYELKVVPLHLELCNIVIATSERIKRELLELAPQADPSRILVKPNGIDTEQFPVVPRAEPAPDAPFRLVTVCRIEPKKGLLELVEAVKLLRSRGRNVEAHIVGTVDEWSQASRDYKHRLDQKITELDLWQKVHLEGRHGHEGIVRFLSLAQLFVAPFLETETGDKDGIPTALLEGMATGLPVVATDAGSITEVVDSGRDGVIVPQGDVSALAAAIEHLLGDPMGRQQMGLAASQTVRQNFDARRESVFHAQLRRVVAGASSVRVRS